MQYEPRKPTTQYSNPTHPMQALTPARRADMALRSSLALVVIVAATILGFTGLGDMLNEAQAHANGGTYSPKLTFMIILAITSLPAIVAYFPLSMMIRKRFARAS
jgi:hypothetical protein